MSKEEIKEYLKNNLKIVWKQERNHLYIALKLEDYIISKIHFEQD